MVRERVPRMQECLLRSSGWEDKESSEDFLRSIEKPRRSTRTSTIISTLDRRVTCSRTRMCWLKPSTRWSKKRSEKSNSKNKEKPERSRLVRRNPRETTERLLLWVSSLKNQRPRKIETQNGELITNQTQSAIYSNNNDLYKLDLVWVKKLSSESHS